LSALVRDILTTFSKAGTAKVNKIWGVETFIEQKSRSAFI